MRAGNSIELNVKRWSGWAPGLSTIDDWTNWANNQKAIEDDGEPDVSFVKPLLRRKLGRVARMAFFVASECLEGEDSSPEYVFCSRFGDYGRTYRILDDITNNEPASALAFSMSVHNASSSMFSIERADIAKSTSLAAGQSTLETAFVEAWSRLQTREMRSVLIVYHDEPLPDLYYNNKMVSYPVAAAFLVTLPDDVKGTVGIRLKWSNDERTLKQTESISMPVLRVLRLLLNGDTTEYTHAERLSWEWSRTSESA